MIENFASAENQTFLHQLVTWLGDTTNGIANIFTKKVTTEQICVTDANGETCLDRSRIDHLLDLDGQINTGISDGFGYGHGM